MHNVKGIFLLNTP